MNINVYAKGHCNLDVVENKEIYNKMKTNTYKLILHEQKTTVPHHLFIPLPAEFTADIFVIHETLNING